MRRHEAHVRFLDYYAKATLKKNKHQDNAPATTAIGHRHARGLNNGGKIKICKRHQIFEVME